MLEGIDIAVLDPGTVQPEVMEEIPELSPGQERALAALLVHPSVQQAAAAAQVGSRTPQGWLAEDDLFNPHPRLARREVLGRMVQSLREGVPALTQYLQEVANDATA